MKTKYLYLTAIFLFSLSAPASAQSETGPFDGLQNSLNEFVGAAAETFQSLNQNYSELIRLGMLLNNDIRMTMNADYEKTTSTLIPMGGVAAVAQFITSERTGELYAEFDWQNMAEKMIAKKSAFQTQYAVYGLGSGSKDHEAEEHTMYVDSQGYWYVPFQTQELDGTGGSSGYFRVNLVDQMQSMVNTLQFSIDAAVMYGVAEMIDQLAFLELGTLEYDELLYLSLPEGLAAALSDPTVSVTGELLSSFSPMLQAQFESQLENISNLPPFIHFALLISPALARSEFSVDEETITSDGEVLLTKMTVTSGKDAGYQLIFDKYGRLVHLRDTDGSTADYMYDRDVTVNIPPAVSINMGSIISND